MVWADEYLKLQEVLENCEKSLIVFTASLRYDAKYSKQNQFTLRDWSEIKILKN